MICRWWKQQQKDHRKQQLRIAEAEQRLEEVIADWPEVERRARDLVERRRQNNFGTMFKQAMRGS
jgi:hypothetical protein